MATLTLIYESLFSDKYKTTLHESIVVICFIIIYSSSSYYSNFLAKDTITILSILGGLYICFVWLKTIISGNETHLRFYILFKLLSRFYSKYSSQSKQVRNEKLLTEAETNKLLFVFIKIFYIPVMLNFTVGNFNEVTDLIFRIQYYRVSDFTIIHWYKLVIPIFFLIDTSYFLFGYLVESKKLGSTVRSVDRSAFSWFITLACYPPLNNVAFEIFPWSANDSNLMYPNTLNYVLLIFVILLFGIYLSATISLGSKCSNLTNRGTVSKGVYKYVRHPAYSAKVLAWWLMTIPVINVVIFVNMLMWSVIYILRAIKEEDHLLQDEEYREYYQKTPNRFIPKLFS